MHSARRNRYYWKLSQSLLNFQMSTPDLLLALQQADSQDKVQQKLGIERV